MVVKVQRLDGGTGLESNHSLSQPQFNHNTTTPKLNFNINLLYLHEITLFYTVLPRYHAAPKPPPPSMSKLFKTQHKHNWDGHENDFAQLLE